MVVINFVVNFEDNFKYYMEYSINMEWISIANNVTDMFMAKYGREKLSILPIWTSFGEFAYYRS